MQTLRLLGAAAEAEGLRLRREAAGVTRRAGWLAATALFGIAGLAAAHVAAIAGLAPDWGLAGAAGLVALGDLVLAGLLFAMGRRRPDPMAEEALILRRTALAAATAQPPIQTALGLIAGSTPLQAVGATLGQALARWVERR